MDMYEEKICTPTKTKMYVEKSYDMDEMWMEDFFYDEPVKTRMMTKEHKLSRKTGMYKKPSSTMTSVMNSNNFIYENKSDMATDNNEELDLVSVFASNFKNNKNSVYVPNIKFNLLFNDSTVYSGKYVIMTSNRLSGSTIDVILFIERSICYDRTKKINKISIINSSTFGSAVLRICELRNAIPMSSILDNDSLLIGNVRYVTVALSIDTNKPENLKLVNSYLLHYREKNNMKRID